MDEDGPRYETIEHTADGGIRVFGRSPAELFANAGYGLFDTVTDLSRVRVRRRRPVSVEGKDLEDLLFSWLSELNFLFQTEGMLFREFDVSTMTDSRVEALLGGEPLNPARHEIRAEIKGVTYHDFIVAKTPSGWEARVLFDL